VGAIPMILSADGDHGRLVPPGSAEALAAALASLGGDPAERDRLGQNARRRARAWTLEAWAGEIGAALEDAWQAPLRRAAEPRVLGRSVGREA
jgi:glycosyltransferase involved in cell wall biosynthesis